MKRTKAAMACFFAVAAIAMSLAVAGCGHKSSVNTSQSASKTASTNTAVTGYQKAAEGGRMTQSQHDAMMAAIAQRQGQQATEQSKDSQAQHVPGRS